MGLPRATGPHQVDVDRVAPDGKSDYALSAIFMIRHLHRIGLPVVVMIPDAEVHPGDHFHLMVPLQRHLLRLSEGVVMLTDFVASKVTSRLSLAADELRG